MWLDCIGFDCFCYLVFGMGFVGFVVVWWCYYCVVLFVGYGCDGVFVDFVDGFVFGYYCGVGVDFV